MIQRITWKKCLGIIFLENHISVTGKNVFGINFEMISGWSVFRINFAYVSLGGLVLTGSLGGTSGERNFPKRFD